MFDIGFFRFVRSILGVFSESAEGLQKGAHAFNVSADVLVVKATDFREDSLWSLDQARALRLSNRPESTPEPDPVDEAK
jgi:hypothetical protein